MTMKNKNTFKTNLINTVALYCEKLNRTIC